jgi:hypothetical protein
MLKGAPNGTADSMKNFPADSSMEPYRRVTNLEMDGTGEQLLMLWGTDRWIGGSTTFVQLAAPPSSL